MPALELGPAPRSVLETRLATSVVRILAPGLVLEGARCIFARDRGVRTLVCHPPLGTECVVCLAGASDTPWTQLRCKHYFHAPCVATWFESESGHAQLWRFSCPLCRGAV